MRFTIKEYEGFRAEILAAGYSEDNYSFVKKRGLLLITDLKSKQVFKYHRKTETSMSDDGRWIETSSYRTNYGNMEEGHADFVHVLRSFQQWLRSG